MELVERVISSLRTDPDKDEFLSDCLNVGGSGTKDAVVRLGPGVMGIPGGGAVYSHPRSTCEERLEAIRNMEFNSPSPSNSVYRDDAAKSRR